MSSLLGINATLELVDRLDSTVREFGTKAKTLHEASDRERLTELKRFQATAQERAARLAEALAAQDADQKVTQDKAKNRFDTRQTRIVQAQKLSRKNALQTVTQREDRHRYTFQKRTLDAERQRESNLANATSRLEKFRVEVGESQDRFAAVEAAAQKAFYCAPEFKKLLSPGRTWPAADSASDEDQLLAELHQLQEASEKALGQFRGNLVLGLFRSLPWWGWVAVLMVAYLADLFVLPRYGMPSIPPRDAAAWLAGLFVLVTLAYFFGKRAGRPAANAIAADLAKANQWHNLCLQKAEARHRQEQERIKNDWETTNTQLNAQWRQAMDEATRDREALPRKIDLKTEHASRKNSEIYQRALQQLDQQHRSAIDRLQQQIAAQQEEATVAHQANVNQLEHKFQEQWTRLTREWESRIQPVWEEIQAANRHADELFPAWDAPSWNSWAPPETFAQATRFGRLEVDVAELAGVNLAEVGLPLPGPSRFFLPLLLKFPEQGSLLFETARVGTEEATQAINSILFRLLALAPPGRVSFTIIDPIALGQNFAGLMHLADYEDSQINSRIWTQTTQIEEKLAELNEHMEKVIQMYLRNEYPTIAEYNAKAGTLAEKYHFVVIAGFPVNFSETAGRRLLNIMASGARCGVYTLIHWDQRHQLPHDFMADDLHKNSVRISADDSGRMFLIGAQPGTRLLLDTPPSTQFATELLHKVGQSTKNSNRVELPFPQIAPPEPSRWTESSAEELRVPIGRSGATKRQDLAIGKGTRQHGLIVGKTGSGKSTLFHVIITSAALRYSPDEVEFYLVDFKKGVEFKCYANWRLPHARVVAIESDREFGLSVLQRIDDELRRRGDLFRNADVQELAGYRKAEPNARLPRVVLAIDEFQEFFTEEDRVSQAAAVLLDRLVRQGRAFGIHVLLGSQTLGGAYTLARATIGQMVIRIALQCNEADAYLIMDENNAAPRLLSRPGEGIYNDTAGSLEGNSPFQTAWLSDDVRDEYLGGIRQLADQSATPRPGPIVFEGNSPADVTQNEPLQSALSHRPVEIPTAPRVWLGAPNSIKGPSEVVFQRQSGSNLLVIGQAEEAVLGIAAISLVSLAAQFPPGTARLILMENTSPGSRERQFLDDVIAAIPYPVLRPKRPELPGLLHGLVTEILARTGEERADEAPTTFLLITNLADHKPLRQEDEFSFASTDSEGPPSAAVSFLTLVTEGPSRGCHVIASVDTYSNVARFLGRKALSEFETRVLFQMSASDSASLMDSPEASKLGLHRALLYNEREGYIEKFRPYALSSSEWIEHAARCLRAR